MALEIGGAAGSATGAVDTGPAPDDATGARVAGVPAKAEPARQELPSPSSLTVRMAPPDYLADWADAACAAEYSVLRDPALHYTLYGHAQGRAYLPRLGRGVSRIILIAPSYLKQCGIGEYGRYLASQFGLLGHEVRIERTTAAVLAMPAEDLAQALVLVNHGPGLFDGLNARLSQGESTATLLANLDRMARDHGAIPVIIHHSLLDTDHLLLFSRQAQILAAPVAQVSFVSSGARHFFLTALELGLSPVEVPPHAHDTDRTGRQEQIGFFGFFQYGGKDFDALIHLARELRAKLVGSVATTGPTDIERLHAILDESGVAHDFSTGWITDAQLMDRLLSADYFYLPQNDYDHWNNSATARFVTQIDRPLFLPPHHPFLDMADGSIFATKHDLPRIAAAIREPARYDQAVDRVRAFRSRAAMIHTARALRDELPDRLARMGQDLLLDASALSCERLLELPAAAQARFLAAMGNPAPKDLARAAPSPWRVPAPLQFWRKHYELGDLIGGTVLESVHAAYLAICKRQPTFAELQDATGALGGAGGKAGAKSGADRTLRAIHAAIAARGGPFHDPEIVFLSHGEVADWTELVTAQSIERFAAEKQERQAAVATLLESEGEGGPDRRPAIGNLADLLVLPAAEIRRRAAAIDLSSLDFDWILAPRRLQDRLNRLLAAASDHGLDLANHFVLDLPIPQPVAPAVLVYVVEDFIYLEGDLFILQAIRALRKRDPLPIESLIVRALVATFGKRAALRYLAARAGQLVRIEGLDAPPQPVIEAEFGVFIANARDPILGLIDVRNAYEIQRRMNERWWLRNKPTTDAYWQEAQGDVRPIIALYAALDVSAATSGKDTAEPSPIQALLDRGGSLFNAEAWLRDSLTISEGQKILATTRTAAALRPALREFHDVEPVGVWSRGCGGEISLQLRASESGATIVRPVLGLEAGFFGSDLLGPRVLQVTVRVRADAASAWVTLSQDVAVLSDVAQSIEIACPDLPDKANATLAFDLSSAISPEAAGRSADSRELGVQLRRLWLRQGETDQGPTPPAGP